jgi:hypothetical protein
MLDLESAGGMIPFRGRGATYVARSSVPLFYMGRRVPIPESVRIALATFFGDDVARVKVIEHSLFARLHWNALATTRRRRIYLRGSAQDFFSEPALMIHEYFHVMNQWEPRRLTTWRYVLESLRRGYWSNRFEVEARQFTADNLDKFYLSLRERSPEGRVRV